MTTSYSLPQLPDAQVVLDVLSGLNGTQFKIYWFVWYHTHVVYSGHVGAVDISQKVMEYGCEGSRDCNCAGVGLTSGTIKANANTLVKRGFLLPASKQNGRHSYRLNPNPKPVEDVQEEPKRQPKPRKRNELLDAVAQYVFGFKPTDVPPNLWARIQKALTAIGHVHKFHGTEVVPRHISMYHKWRSESGRDYAAPKDPAKIEDEYSAFYLEMRDRQQRRKQAKEAARTVQETGAGQRRLLAEHWLDAGCQMMDASLREKLEERGIYKAAVKYGWKQATKRLDGQEVRGWDYPLFLPNGRVHPGAGRWKNAETEKTGGKFKYMWTGKKTDDIAFYLLPGAVEAMRESREAFVLGGEPDCLSVRVIDVANALCWFGERNIPESLEAFLSDLGVRKVSYVPDLDQTGMKAAADVYHRLSGSFELRILKLPYDVKEEAGGGADTNLMLQSFRDEPDVFSALWGEMKPLPHEHYSMYIPVDVPEQKRLSPGRSSLNGSLPDDFINALVMDLGVKGYKTDGWCKPNITCPNPAHEDKVGSAQWHRDKHICKCHSCHGPKEFWLATKVGEFRNIHIKDFVESRHDRQAPPPDWDQAPPPDWDDAPPPHDEPQGPDTDAPPLLHVTDEMRGDKVLARLDQEIYGRRIPQEQVFPFPFRSMHPFGGFHKSCFTGKITMIIAPSGGGKTQWCETANDSLNAAGISGKWWGIEWNSAEMMMRRIQRWSNGEITYGMLMEHRSYLSYQAQGVSRRPESGDLAQ